jgi:hypothetical protein
MLVCTTPTGEHALLVTCERKWWRLFWPRRSISCWHCTLHIPEP